MPARPTVVLPVARAAPDPAVIARAAAVLRGGGLVAFPTETVYGLGGAALDPTAVAAIYAAKGRPATDPVIVHLAAAADLALVAAVVPPAAAALATACWPGPLTLIVPKADGVPAAVTAGLPNVAVRVPDHPVALALLRAAGVPVAAPSANRFSRPSPTTAAHVVADLDGAIDLVLDAGPTDIGVESTIVDCTVQPPLVRRAGGVSIERLRGVVPAIATVDGDAAVERPQVAPGQLLRHYAPVAPLTVFAGPPAAVVQRLIAEVRSRTAAGQRVGVLAPEDDLLAIAGAIAAPAAAGRVVTASLGRRAAPDQAARRLFAALRTLDGEGVEVIVGAGPDRRDLGVAVWDRLRRAAEGRVVGVG
ncbi:MAG: L-threonylcarbamoyladenylate synthase [Vicinamibacterales bacterium]